MSDFDYGSIPVGYYDDVYRRRRGVQSRWHHDKFRLFQGCLKAGERHLDVGCGPGTFIATLPESVLSTGVDIAAEQIAYARRANARSGATYETITPGTLPFADGAFDVVSAIELVEHLRGEEISRLVREVYRVLRPGGRALFSTPNYASLWPVVEALVNRLGPVSYDGQHVTRFNARTLREKLADSPWSQLDVRAYQFLAPFAAALGWRASEVFARLEPDFLVSRQGLLLFAEARK